VSSFGELGGLSMGASLKRLELAPTPWRTPRGSGGRQSAAVVLGKEIAIGLMRNTRLRQASR
jgi:hypothetical protein